MALAAVRERPESSLCVRAAGLSEEARSISWTYAGQAERNGSSPFQRHIEVLWQPLAAIMVWIHTL
ncbi:hypothetical protein MJO28_014174 [Puccinia striiformis f. sp. tritici]|uniref:Uncharacterized protein n=1 Tax=Puccinia striiformis f. sp. tritici TaxID=168172 RepID=A0ACC0DUT1_9BASI|nr:hypothetical protein MJO28_014174 [Puccinia striiformis f. sp. tritici]